MGDSVSVDRFAGVMASVAYKAPADCASTGALVLFGLQTVDGVVLTETNPPMRCLVKNQVDSKANGIYDVHALAWKRSPDFDGARDAVQGTRAVVYGGTQGGTTWSLTTANPVVIGTAALVFTQVVIAATVSPQLAFASGSGLAAADVQAAGNGGLVVLDGGNTNLAAPLTLSAKQIILAGGTVTLGAFNLTIHGTVIGYGRTFICNCAGRVIFINKQKSWLDWFAVGDNVTDDTTNVKAWIYSSPIRDAEAGGWLSDTAPIDVMYHSPQGIKMVLSGRQNSIFTSKLGNDLFQVTRNDTTLHTWEIGEFTCVGQGAGVGTGYALNITATANEAFAWNIHDIYAVSMGGGCVKDVGGHGVLFDSIVRRCEGDLCGSFIIDLAGDNTLKMELCYGHNIAAAAAAYRIRSSQMLADSCNGIDSGPVIWLLGSSTSVVAGFAADAYTAYACPTLLNCNIEDYGLIGIVCKGGSVIIAPSTTFAAPAAGTGYKAILTAGGCPSLYFGQIQKYENVSNSKGGTFANSIPVHNNNNVPFSLVATALTASVSMYDDQNALTQTVSCQSRLEPSASRFPVLFGRVAFTGLPTASTGLASGEVWLNANVLTIVP